jgi:hypothetical protein
MATATRAVKNNEKTKVGKKATDASAAVGNGMESLLPQTMPPEGALRTAKDVTDLIRRNPVPALLVSIGIGLLLAKVTVWGFTHGK